MWIGGPAAVSATVLCGRAQQLQIRSAKAADNSVLFPVLDRLSVFEPLKGHVWSILSLALKLGCVANADVDGFNFLLEHRLNCDVREKEREKGGEREKEIESCMSKQRTQFLFSFKLVIIDDGGDARKVTLWRKGELKGCKESPLVKLEKTCKEKWSKELVGGWLIV